MATVIEGSFFDRLPSDELVSVCVVERLAAAGGGGGGGGDGQAAQAAHAQGVFLDLVVWKFPSLDAPLESVLLARSPFLALPQAADANADADEAEAEAAEARLYSHSGGLWHYSAAAPVRAAAGAASARAVIVLSRVFCPDKFCALAAALLPCAAAPPRLLEAWLLAGVRGALPAAPGAGADAAPRAWPGRSWDISAAADAARGGAAGLRALLAAVGVEAILLWTAMALRRRVAVVGASGDVRGVAAAVCALPHLAPQRLRVTVDASGATRAGAAEAAVALDLGVALFPLVVLRGDGGGVHAHARSAVEAGVAAQLAELNAAASTGGVVAGFVGEVPPEHLWDVLLDLSAGTVAVADAAAADFAMTPLHKGVAKSMLAALAADGGSDASVAAALAAKGSALLAQVLEVIPSGRLDAAQEAEATERLRAAGLPEVSQRFARALARAAGT